MQVRPAIFGAVVMAAVASFASVNQANAQNFTFTSHFGTPQIVSNTSFLTLTDNASSALGAPSNIILGGVAEFTAPGTGPNTFTASPYSTVVTIVDLGSGDRISHTFLGSFSGTADGGPGGNAPSALITETPITLSEQYVFASGTYTVTRTNFTPPGPGGIADGALGAQVTFTPAAAVPEMGSVVALMLGGSMLGLMAFRRRSAFRPLA